MACTIAVIVIAPRTRMGRTLVLNTAITEQHPDQDLVKLLGKSGTAVSPLHPTGAAEIEGQRIDVVTDGEFIVAGSKIHVVSVEGTRVVVANDA